MIAKPVPATRYLRKIQQLKYFVPFMRKCSVQQVLHNWMLPSLAVLSES